jgi:hypothetical protein
MGRARDISKVFSTGTALATDTEVSGSYLTQSSASTVYQTKATAGLTLLNTTSFTAQTAVSINDVFSSTYRNYKILVTIDDNASNPSDLLVRLRVSNTDASSGNYRNHGTYINYGGGLGNYGSGTSSTGWYVGTQIAQSQGRGTLEIMSPFETKHTGFIGHGGGGDLSVVTGGRHTLDTSYTGFTIYPDAGNIDGTVSVYGYNK